jgi:phosphate transport system substrate-binding protein
MTGKAGSIYFLAAVMLMASVGLTANPTSAFSRLFFQEEVAIIVHKSNPVENLSLTELRQIFLAERSRWPSGRKVTIVMREPGRPEREAVLRQVCRMRDQDFTRHFLSAKFTGATVEEPKLLTSSDGMLKFVFNAPGAIGYVRAVEVNASVKVVRVDGRAPGEAGYKLKL